MRRDVSVLGHSLSVRELARSDLAKLDTTGENLSDEQDGSVLGLLVEICRRSAKHSCGDVLGTVWEQFEE